MITGLEKEALAIAWVLVLAIENTIKDWNLYDPTNRVAVVTRLDSILSLYQVICEGKPSDQQFIASARKRIDLLAGNTQSYLHTIATTEG